MKSLDGRCDEDDARAADHNAGAWSSRLDGSLGELFMLHPTSVFRASWSGLKEKHTSYSLESRKFEEDEALVKNVEKISL